MNAAAFETTHWSVVLAAGNGAADALARLCSAYWPPVFAFVRRQGYATEDAQDLTQGFFARLIEHGDLAAADQSRGRFRTFLLAACRHFLANDYDRRQALKRGGGAIVVSVDDVELADTDTPERLFDRQWSLTLLERVLDSLREEYVRAGNAVTFDRLREFLTAGETLGSQSTAAHDLGMSTGAVKVAIHRLRRRYRIALREHIAETVESPDDVDDEIRYLLSSLAV